MLEQRGADGELVGRGTGPVGEKARRRLITRVKNETGTSSSLPQSPAQDAPPRAGSRLLHKQVSKLLFLQHTYFGLRREVTHLQVVTSYDQNGLSSDMGNTRILGHGEHKD